jgi:membrane protease YdiL (CAAX protease family)
MVAASPLSSQTQPHRIVSLTAWAAILVLSDLPEVILHGQYAGPLGWLRWVKAALLVGLIVLTTLWPRLRPLRSFAFVFLVFLLALQAREWVGDLAGWQARFGGDTPSFAQAYASFHLRDVVVALVVLGAVYLVTKRRSAFYLVRGHLGAAIEPVPWLGIRPGESWRTFGWIFTFSAALAVLIVLVTSVPLRGEALLRAAPLWPVILLLAAANAFAEEAYFRCSLFGTLHSVVGTQPVLLMNAVLFGMAHYMGGSPPGVVGAVLTGFLGWLLGKAMLETRGFTWSWIIHFVPDALFFASYAVLWG